MVTMKTILLLLKDSDPRQVKIITCWMCTWRTVFSFFVFFCSLCQDVISMTSLELVSWGPLWSPKEGECPLLKAVIVKKGVTL
jgi:hypothetical protein